MSEAEPSRRAPAGGEAAAAPPPAPDPAPPPEPVWASWTDERLLDLRLCDLKVRIRGSVLEQRLRELGTELKARGLHFRPYFWLSNEWYCPDGVAGIAIPFYLAHPRLVRLEQSKMFEVEGGTHESCMRLLRHETGHAIDNAYRLRLRRRRQRLFGPSSERYHEDYMPRPYSRRFVIYLEGWYAQSHPDEDFAETFAAWLDPRYDWKERYGDWPAIKKLEYMDRLMAEIAAQPPLVTRRRRVEPLGRLRQTLREYYEEKQERYAIGEAISYDRDLKRLFSNAPEFRRAPSAARFIRGLRKELRPKVAKWTGVYQYTIDQVIGEMIARCRQLGLRLAVPAEQARTDFMIALTVHTMKYIHAERHRYVR